MKWIGLIKSATKTSSGLDVLISSNLALNIDDSVSVNGVCSTVTEFSDGIFKVQYSTETLGKTTFKTLKENQSVNLEPSLAVGDPLGGHFVTGHVDTTGEMASIKSHDDYKEITLSFPEKFEKYLIPKGSICIDGISLTVNSIENNTFSCYIIPHTISNTTLSQSKEGDQVNLEFDMMGKYLYRFYELRNND